MNMRNALPSLSEGGLPAGLDSLRQEIEKTFDEFSQGFELPETGNAPEVHPEMDIHDNGKKVKLSLEIPGVEEQDIEVTLSGRVISISGEKKSSMEATPGGIYRSERTYGHFLRSVALPFDVDPDKVKAKLDNGVLTVSVSKPAAAAQQAKKIPIGG